MEKNEKGGPAFDLEKDLTGPNKTQKLADYRKLITARIEELKKNLREGEGKEEFVRAETLLNGYNSALQVLERAAR